MTSDAIRLAVAKAICAAHGDDWNREGRRNELLPIYGPLADASIAAVALSAPDAGDLNPRGVAAFLRISALRRDVPEEVRGHMLDAATLLAPATPVQPSTASVEGVALDGGRPLPFDRETGGRLVREAWQRWARQQPNPKASWLVDYDELEEADKEADRQIAEVVGRWTLIHDAARLASLTPTATPGWLADCAADIQAAEAALAKPPEPAGGDAVREALRAIYEWYDRDGSVGGASVVFERHRAALSHPRPEQVEDEKATPQLTEEIELLIQGIERASWICRFGPWDKDKVFAVRHTRDARARITALALARPAPKPAADVPAGWRLVPEEPDARMHAAGASVLSMGQAYVWRAMCAAAPTPANAATEKEGGQFELASASYPQETWQDIATAPKDGTSILLYAKCEGVDVGRWEASYGSHGEWMDAQGYTIWGASHWTPLPMPPSPLEDSKAGLADAHYKDTPATEKEGGEL